MTESILSPIGAKKKKSPWKIVKTVLKAIVIIVFMLALSASAQVIYMYQRYEPFYVSGESMWPTLNYGSRYFDGSGDSMAIDPSSGDYNKPGTYLCDYGLMDSQPGFVDRLERFDIVVAYNSEPVYGDDGQMSNNPSEVIKRIIALPGESFYFETEDLDKLGTLYVKAVGSDDFVEVSQPFYDPSLHPEWTEKDLSDVEAAKTSGTVYRTSSRELFPYLGGKTYVLGEDEYFLCGDNRAHSGDSRTRGPFKESQLVGRAVAIIGKAAYTVESSGKDHYEVSLADTLMPWDYLWLVA